MSEFQLKTPVAFIIFNRPDTTERVFAEIAKAKPPKLLVVADGARANRPGEAEKVAAARAIINRVDWDCEVLTHFSEVNLGCKVRVSSGIDWVFEQVEEAIILEDDCLPHPSFFPFCEQLLVRYRHDTRIAMISGDNFQFGKNKTDASYYFSRYNHIWGWASWRRAWQHYDVEIKIWPTMRDSHWLSSVIPTRGEQNYWARIFEAVHAGRIDTWDYQWTLATWAQGMHAIMPSSNLIANIGFGQEATHTQGASIYANMPVYDLTLPLTHPIIMQPLRSADNLTALRMFTSNFPHRILQKILVIIRSILR